MHILFLHNRAETFKTYKYSRIFLHSPRHVEPFLVVLQHWVHLPQLLSQYIIDIVQVVCHVWVILDTVTAPTIAIIISIISIISIATVVNPRKFSTVHMRALVIQLVFMIVEMMMMPMNPASCPLFLLSAQSLFL